MSRVTLPPGQDAGAVGYPMVSTTMAGIELLGTLTSIRTYRPDAGDSHFSWFWANFLNRLHPEYSKKAAQPLRDLVRHGLSHIFLTAAGVQVTKGDRRRHLRYYPSHRLIFIDCLQLFDDLQDSYVRGVRPIVEGQPYTLPRRRDGVSITRETMQSRLDELLEHTVVVANTAFAKLPADGGGRVAGTTPVRHASSLPQVNISTSGTASAVPAITTR